MKVILLEDIDRVGKAGEIVEASEGFSRNYLFPQKKALKATDGALKQYEARKRAITKQQASKKEEAENLAKKFENLILEVKANVGDEGKLFGSITTQDIHLALSEKGYEVSKKHIDIAAPFREIGTYPVTLRLHPEVEVSIQINIS